MIAKVLNFLPLSFLGGRVISSIEYTINLLTLSYLSTRTAIFHQRQGFRTLIGVISAQIYFTGWQALPLISGLALASGGIVILQSATQLSKFGGAQMIGELLVAIVIRELGPLITALIVIARSGTAVASEVANMRVNKEIEALESFGINPLSYIIFPRLVGVVVSVVCLAIYFIFVAVLGGFVISQFIHDLGFGYFIDNLAQAISGTDILFFFLKITFSGLIIFTVSSYQGYIVLGSPHEVPQATTQAVVVSVIYVMVFNLTLTILSYISTLEKFGVI